MATSRDIPSTAPATLAGGATGRKRAGLKRAEPLALGALAGIIGYHVAQATVATTVCFDRHIAQPFGLRKVEFSLLQLVLANGPLSPKRLGEALALTAPNLTQVLDRLQSRGLIRRERSESDRRSQNIMLTPEGLAMAEAGALAATSMERDLDLRLSPAERMMLVELLRKVAGR